MFCYRDNECKNVEKYGRNVKVKSSFAPPGKQGIFFCLLGEYNLFLFYLSYAKFYQHYDSS
jgi:hypothetical protein